MPACKKISCMPRDNILLKFLVLAVKYCTVSESASIEIIPSEFHYSTKKMRNFQILLNGHILLETFMEHYTNVLGTSQCPKVVLRKFLERLSYNGHWDVPRTFVACYINVSNIVCPLGCEVIKHNFTTESFFI